MFPIADSRGRNADEISGLKCAKGTVLELQSQLPFNGQAEQKLTPFPGAQLREAGTAAGGFCPLGASMGLHTTDTSRKSL